MPSRLDTTLFSTTSAVAASAAAAAALTQTSTGTASGSAPSSITSTPSLSPSGRGSELRSRISSLKLDTETEQTTKASYYLAPEQTKKLDDLRAAFRHEGGYAPREASYSRIVGLAIERLHEEVFSSNSRGGSKSWGYQPECLPIHAERTGAYSHSASSSSRLNRR